MSITNVTTVYGATPAQLNTAILAQIALGVGWRKDGAPIKDGSIWYQSMVIGTDAPGANTHLYSAVSASDDLLASAGASAHVDFAQTYSLPASTLGAGSRLRVSGSVAVVNASGTDTLEVKVYIGATVLITTLAVDPTSTSDFVNFNFELISRAAAAAAASCVGHGSWVSNVSGTEARGAAILAPTNLATNGALTIKVSAKWSSTTASTKARLAALDISLD